MSITPIPPPPTNELILTDQRTDDNAASVSTPGDGILSESPAAPSAPAGEPAVQSPAMPGLSRRGFLSGALTSAAALLAACGGDPTPTPSLPPQSPLSPLPTPGLASQSLYFPFAANDGHIMPTPGPEPTLEPTPTKTPKPTKTPSPPTPTPTPPATPFPAGPPSKLGLFVGHNDPTIFDLLKSGGVAVVKTLELDANFVAEIKRTSPRTLVIGRIDLPQIDLNSLDPLPAARDFVSKVLVYADDSSRRPSFDAWEAFNEPVAVNADEMKKLADFEAERTRLLGERGIRSVIGNFGTGQPELALWEHFLPAVQAAKENDGWLGLHEYSAPTIYFLSSRENQGRYPGVSPEDTGWLTLRYRKVYNEWLRPRGLDIPLVFTEIGVDGLVTNRPGPPDARGWQEFQGFWAENGYGLWGPGAYIEQLVWYDQAMQQDSYVLGGAIYAVAPTAGWETYDIRGPASAVLAQYLSVHALA